MSIDTAGNSISRLGNLSSLKVKILFHKVMKFYWHLQVWGGGWEPVPHHAVFIFVSFQQITFKLGILTKNFKAFFLAMLTDFSCWRIFFESQKKPWRCLFRWKNSWKRLLTEKFLGCHDHSFSLLFQTFLCNHHKFFSAKCWKTSSTIRFKLHITYYKANSQVSCKSTASEVSFERS